MYIPPPPRLPLLVCAWLLVLAAATAFVVDLSAYTPCIACIVHMALVALYLLFASLYFTSILSTRDPGTSSGLLVRTAARSARLLWSVPRRTMEPEEVVYAPIVESWLFVLVVLFVLIGAFVVDQVGLGEQSCFLLPLFTIVCVPAHAANALYFLRKREGVLPPASMSSSAIAGAEIP